MHHVPTRTHTMPAVTQFGCTFMQLSTSAAGIEHHTARVERAAGDALSDVHVQLAVQWVEHAIKLLHLLAPTAHALQSSAGAHMAFCRGPAARFKHIATGTFDPLMRSVLAAPLTPLPVPTSVPRLASMDGGA